MRRATLKTIRRPIWMVRGSGFIGPLPRANLSFRPHPPFSPVPAGATQFVHLPASAVYGRALRSRRIPVDL